MRTRVKICGISRVEDGLAAARAGADAIGLVFYARSPRAVTAEQARAIAQALPPFVARVGLFLDAPAATVRAVLEQVPLDLLQFHGDECPADCGGYGRPYIKAIAMGDATDVASYMASYPDAQGFLLDSHAAGQAGGTGRRFEWSRVPTGLERPVVLAGGLDPTNVGQAVRSARPYALDVSSGVEREPGIKDAERIAAFIEEVRRVDNE